MNEFRKYTFRPVLETIVRDYFIHRKGAKENCFAAFVKVAKAIMGRKLLLFHYKKDVRKELVFLAIGKQLTAFAPFSNIDVHESLLLCGELFRNIQLRIIKLPDRKPVFPADRESAGQRYAGREAHRKVVALREAVIVFEFAAVGNEFPLYIAQHTRI